MITYFDHFEIGRIDIIFAINDKNVALNWYENTVERAEIDVDFYLNGPSCFALDIVDALQDCHAKRTIVAYHWLHYTEEELERLKVADAKYSELRVRFAGSTLD